ncbi:hypothetical protein [Paenarthrobacter aurescens]|uniref:hypothetical protein n=1 Tax=Paenarthrobacter aurescens TaxID=43663 RepID=UPI0021BE87FA|nr:hypothetical protein [Paenarthrobacter aurescens]MCT9869157.1 hypothetical protein [Paenarthrobacter aurescens]
MDRKTVGVEQIRQGISRAALAHNVQIEKLQAELRDAYQREVGMASVVAERRQFSQELYTARIELNMYREKLAASEAELAERERQLNDLSRAYADTESKLAALSKSALGALQLKYWRLRRRKRQGKA